MAIRVEVRVNRQRPCIIETHREARRIAASHVTVLLSAVKLELLLVKTVHEVACATTGQVVRAWRQRAGTSGRLRTSLSRRWNKSVDLKGRVGKMASEWY